MITEPRTSGGTMGRLAGKVAFVHSGEGRRIPLTGARPPVDLGALTR